jgi:hypothetical protein
VVSTALREQLAGRRKRPAPPPWRFPLLSSFAPGQLVLALDATLSHCGWVLLYASEGQVIILGRGTISPVTERRSFLETWDKAARLREELDVLRTALEFREYRVAVEAPSVGGGHRTESSLIAGTLVHLAWPDAVPVHVAHISALLTGDGRMASAQRKPAIRRAVSLLVPEAAGRTWNEHQRDAVAVGLTWLHDIQERAREQS